MIKILRNAVASDKIIIDIFWSVRLVLKTPLWIGYLNRNQALHNSCGAVSSFEELLDEMKQL